MINVRGGHVARPSVQVERDTQPYSLMSDDEFAGIVMPIGYTEVLLSLDLGRFFESHKDVAGDTDLVLLGSHVERVLWSFGIVLSTPAPEQIWMDVFVDEQFENVRLLLRA